MQTKHYSLSSLIVLLTVFFSLQSVVIRAQDAGFEAGLAGQTANMTSNVIGMNTIANKGAAKIKSGRATTTFVHSPDIYSYVASSFAWGADEPQTKSEQVKFVQEYVSRFEARMMRYGGYKLHDNADASSFACLLSYEAYHDKKMSSSQLVKFRQMRQSGRQSYLNYATYQGSSEQLKEKLYVFDAMMGEQAIEWREKARTARTDAERKAADKEAKEYAKYRLISEEKLR